MRKSVIIVFMSILFITLPCTVSQTVHAEVNDNVYDNYEHPNTSEKQTNEIQKEDTHTEDTNVTGSSTVSFMDYVKMIFALVFVVALIYVLLKFVNKKSRSYQQTKMIHHLGGSPLGGNRSVQLVKIGKRVFILGVGENIELLKEIEDEVEKEELIQFYDEKTPQLSNPKEILSRLIPFKLDKSSEDVETSTGSFQTMLKTQIEDIRNGRKKALEDIKQKESSKDE